jgi:ATP-dependent RNA helicase DDX41
VIRTKLRIDVMGGDVPPPITTFTAMRLPQATLKCLKKERIVTPTPIQIQGLPVLLSGRDCVGISYTGSGKTLVFALPMLLGALQVLSLHGLKID